MVAVLRNSLTVFVNPMAKSPSFKSLNRTQRRGRRFSTACGLTRGSSSSDFAMVRARTQALDLGALKGGPCLPRPPAQRLPLTGGCLRTSGAYVLVPSGQTVIRHLRPERHHHRLHDRPRLEHDTDVNHLAESHNLFTLLGNLLDRSCVVKCHGLGHNAEEQVRACQP